MSRKLDAGWLPHVVAAWHGHSPAVMLGTHSHVSTDTMRRVAAAAAE